MNELGETVNFFAPDDPTSYNFSTTTTVYDSAGAAHQVTMYFYKDATDPKQYNVSVAIDDVVQPETGALLFDNSGALDPASATALNLASYAPANADAQAININFEYYWIRRNLCTGHQPGWYAAGELAGFEFDRIGIAYATFTNGETRAVGQVALATFTNPGGLQPAGKTMFAESTISGMPSIGVPETAARGVIRPSALESANVDLTVELLALIEAQRNFQSNAQAIQNENDASQAILQLR